MSDRYGTRGEIERAVTAYGRKKYEEGYSAGKEEAANDKRYKTITDAVTQAYEEGQHKASELYEQIIEKQESERLKLCEEIKCLEKKIKQMERKDLPYDAMGDYSHRPQKNVYTIGEIRLFDDNDRKYRE